MSNFYYKISGKDIRQAVSKKITGPMIALSKNPEVMSKITDKAIQIVTPYVPMKSGDLRRSAHTVYHARRWQAVWGMGGIGKTSKYATYQHNADDSNWKRTTPGTKSYWTEEVAPGSSGWNSLIAYATKLVKQEVRKNGKR